MANDFKFGNIETPPGIENYGAGPQGLILLLNNLLKIIIFVGGLIALVNLITSAIQYIGSSGNPKNTEQASSRIWMSLLGLLVIAASIGVAALIGFIFFGSSTAILSPTIKGPGQ